MDATLRKKLISGLKSLIKKIDNGWCDEMTSDQYDRLIQAFSTLLEIDLETRPVTNKKEWNIFRNFGKE